MAKAGMGNDKTPEQRAQAKKHSNPGGERTEGLLFKHMILGGSKHIGRYLQTGSTMTCSICGAEV